MGCRRRYWFPPANSEAVGVAQIDARNVRNLVFKRLVIDGDKAAHLFHQVAASQQQLDAGAGTAGTGGQEPTPAFTQFQARNREAQRPQHLAQHLILLHDLLLSPLWAEQLWQVFVVRQFLWRKRLALVVQQRLVAPTRHWQLLFEADHHLVRPHATNFGMGDPRHLLKLGAHTGQVDGEEARRHVRGDPLLHRLLADVAEVALHGDLGDRPVGVRQQTRCAFVSTKAQHHQQHRPEQTFQKAEIGFRQARGHRLFRHHSAGTPWHRLAAGCGG